MATTETPTDLWHGFVDDAAIFPPGEAPLHEATAAYGARPAEDAAYVGSFVLKDTDLPLVRGFGAPLAVVVTGGAGQLAGPAGLCERLGLRLAGLEVALRDLDDLAGNARRVTAALGSMGEVGVHVELPVVEPTASWLAAADEVAAAELSVKLRTGGLTAEAFPTPEALAACIDAALDRELRFKCTAGLHRALRHDADDGFTHHGFLNVLLATGRAFDGAGREVVVQTLVDPSPDLDVATLATGRRWFTSFGCCGVDEPIADLRALGLADPPQDVLRLPRFAPPPNNAPGTPA